MHFDEPSPRFAPFISAVDGQIYMWGGRTEDFSMLRGKKMVSIETFDCYLESWTSETTEGDPPLWLYRGACASSGHNIYTYGGTDGQARYGSLYEFNTRTSSWRELAPHCANSPMKKWGHDMAVCGEKCVLFGGYGIPSGPIQSGVEFVRNNSRINGSWWTNEMHIFDLKKGGGSFTLRYMYRLGFPYIFAGTWSSPIVSGTRPPPCSDFSFTMMDDNHAVLFGGYHSGKRKSNDVYIIDLTTMVR